MKLSAIFLIVLVLGLIFYNSKKESSQLHTVVRTNIPDAGPVNLRPPALDLPLPIVGPHGHFHNTKTTKWLGKVVHLVFWAQWCEPCRIELPVIEKEQLEHRKDYKAVLIDVDSTMSTRIAALKLAKQKAPDVTLAFDKNGSLETNYNIQALPLHVLIDRKGRIVTMFTSTIYGRPQFDRLLGELISEH